MSIDFSKYQTIIERLRGEVGLSDFEAKFASLTKNIAKTDKFLLKMEIKRLASACTRLIDLRGFVNGECRPYEHDDRIHFLDDIAIKVFEENVAYYNGYTFGVYDAVTNTENNFRVIYQKEKAIIQQPDKQTSLATIVEKTQYPAAIFTTENYYDRAEERMNYVINMSVIVDSSTIIEVVSSDISISGCKLRLVDSKPLYLDQIIELRFIGLEQEFKFNEKFCLFYQVRNIHLIDNVQLVGVERVLDESAQSDSFQRFLSGYIKGNKRRYKINLDNTINALHIRAFEHFALPKSNELPVFIDKEKLTVKYVMTCLNNQSLYQYFQDENCNSTLHFLLNKKRIEQLKKMVKLESSLLVYCFIHQNDGKHYFYSADESQLKQDKDSMVQFLGFAASKTSFTILNLSLINVQPATAYSPYSLSRSVSRKDQYLNLPLSAQVKDEVEKLKYIITIADITTEDMVKEYQQLDCQVRDIGKLKQFGHRKISKVNMIDEIDINYSNQRQEIRFIYNTPVRLSKNTVSWSGSLKDFSASGMKVELDKPGVLNKGEVVFLSLPKLQKMTSQFDLKQMPYEIMRINKQKTVMSLHAYIEQHQHIGRTFFKFLIDKNRDKLKRDEYAFTIPGLARAFRNLLAHSFLTPTLIVQTSGSRYKTEVVICSHENGELLAKMKQLSDRDNHYNLYPLFHNPNVLDNLDNTLKKLQVDDAPYSDVLYISVKANIESIENAVITKRASELSSPQMKKMFIKRAMKLGSFYCVQMKLSRTEEPDMAFLNPELSYISSYAIHRAKQLEQEIWSVSGVIQLVDITHEAMTRYKLL